MSAQNRRPILSIVAIVTILSLILAANLAQAASVTPVVVPGNPSCQDQFPGTTEFKIEPVALRC